MDLTPETIKALMDAFDRSDWREMTVTVGGNRLHVSRDAASNGAPPAPAPPQLPPGEAPAGGGEAPGGQAAAGGDEAAVGAAPAAGAPAAAAPVAVPDGAVVESPSVGLFWRAPAPGAPPFVEVGDEVAAGDTVGIVEVMKLMNHVVATVDGAVSAVLVENGAAVEYGQALVVVEPGG